MGISSTLLAHEGLVRFLISATCLGVLIGVEWARPARRLLCSKVSRWRTNFGIAFLNIGIVRLLAPGVTIATAFWAESHNLGLLPLIGLGGAAGGILAFVVLDLAIFAQHVATHHVALLWRIHQVHHADRDLDVTTGLRFHPFEILFSLAVKIALILLLGAPALAVIVFEIVLNATSLFSHANIALPPSLDRALRLVTVTPAMHRIHHSVLTAEANSNFGFNLSLWDRLFGTYRAAAQGGENALKLGLFAHQTAGPQKFFWSLVLPWR